MPRRTKSSPAHATPTPVRTAIFVRVSTLDQQYRNQIEELTSLCQRSNWEIVETYSEKVSGTKSINERPELSRMMMDARRRKFDRVVVYDCSRLGRSLRHIVNVLEELHELNIHVFSFVNGIDTATPTGQLLWHFLSIFSQWEHQIRKERISLGIMKAKANGVKFGRSKMNPNRRRMLRKQVLELRNQGMSIGKISRQLGCGTAIIYEALRLS